MGALIQDDSNEGRRRRGWTLFLLVTVALFYWKILFTKQFSILWLWEPVTESYSWYNFAASTIHKGILPLWDPFRFSGNTFIGGMETGLFYPLKFLLYLMPLDANGMVSERVYNEFYILTHVLAAFFMFRLVKHLTLSHFAAVVAGMSFSLGGFLGNTVYPHTLDSGIWLPLIVLFYLRSIHETSKRRCMFWACLSGLSIGMTILAGGIHILIMCFILIVTLALFLCFGRLQAMRAAQMAVVVGVVALLFGAIQLLPSIEYAPISYRWVGAEYPIQFQQKVPYQFLGGTARFSPRSVFTFLFGAASPGDHLPSNYFGVLPFLLSIIGAWRGWHKRWVKYFAVVAIISYLYTWGEFSFLHGLLYLLPGLDIAREAGRFILLTHFATAILAAYGIDVLFGQAHLQDMGMQRFVKTLRWLVIFIAAILIADTVRSVAIDDSSYMSFIFIVGSYIVLELVTRQHEGLRLKLALLFLIVWDLYEFNYPVRNKAVMQAQQQDHMAELLDSKKLVDFFKSKGSDFRIHFDADLPPNIGDSYGIPMTGGMAATMLVDYLGYLGHARMPELLNVRYTVRKTAQPTGAVPVFSDGPWRVYENPHFGPRAWVVHEIEIDGSHGRPPKRLDDSDFDAGRVALLETPLRELIDPPTGTHAAAIEMTQNESTSIEFRVQTKGRGLLIISEVFYPGWVATVNGQDSTIYRADGLLRGVHVPDGNSVVKLEYRPRSFRIGVALTLSSLIGTMIIGLWSYVVGGKNLKCESQP